MKKAISRVEPRLMASDLFWLRFLTELDVPKASDGDGYYYRYARYKYGRGNNNSV